MSVAQNPNAHPIQCKDHRAIQVWKTALMKLDTWMTSVHMDPDLRKAILVNLTAWQSGRTPPQPSPFSDFKKALINQTSIGWYPFLMGHVSVHWKGTQQYYYTWLGKQNTGKNADLFLKK